MQTSLPGPIILDLQGNSLTAEEKEILLHPHVGGVIFFSRHYESPAQMASLTKAIKALRSELLLCVDQEGGRVQRFKEGFTRLPPLKILGDIFEDTKDLNHTLDLSEKWGQLMALEVRSVGIDLSFAPVVDLGSGISTVIQDRAFHHDPHKVAALAQRYCQGMATWGMSATAKHFPGHGSIALDSHLGLPVDQRTVEELSADLIPFQQLIHTSIPAMMTAHIVYPNIDAHPVSFSHHWIQNFLRGKMRFEGTIISDDLSMGGAVGMGSYADRAKMALSAGCDYVLICNHREGACEAIDAISVTRDSAHNARRQRLLATKSVPAWDELSQFPQWQALKETITQ